MDRNRSIFPLALMIALAVHLLLFLAADRYYIHHNRTLHHDVQRLKTLHQPAEILLQLEPPPEVELDLGKSDATADAVNEIDLPGEMTAREADQIQAPLTRDPVARSDPDDQPQHDAPVPPPAPPTPPVLPADQPPASAPPPPPLSHEITQPDGAQQALPPQPGQPDQPALRLFPLNTFFANATQPPSHTTPQPADQPAAAHTGDPLPPAESDSDPFHVDGAITFHAGKVDAQFGRAIKTVRPRIRLAGVYDGIALRYPSVTLRIRTDAQGHVRAAEVIESSGSLNIDQPVLVAVYAWWIEPPKDANGNPRPDVFTFKLNFR